MQWDAYLKQGGMYYSSGRMTSMGYGMGAGISATNNRQIIIQTDFDIYWLNGNAFKNSLSIGYKKSGVWSPAALGNFSILSGSRSEVLSKDGSRPSPMVGLMGLHLEPLRFENKKGFVSALEFTLGFGHNNGLLSELTLFCLGVKL